LLKVWRAQLAELRGDEARPGLTDEKLSLDAIIGLSYAALPDDATRAAAALAAFGATPLDWDWDALAAVWATDEETTATREQALVASGLLDYDVESERYSLHQTVEAFLALRAEPAAYERHAAYYAALMQRCNQEIKQESTIDAALATLDREIGQMERGQQRAAEAEPTPFWDARLIDYAFACWTYFNLRGRYDQMIAWGEAGREAAQRQGREREAATLLNNIATAYYSTGRYDEAIAAYEEAIAVHRSLNQEADLALDLGNLGNVYNSQGRYDEAIAHYQQSLDIAHHIGAVAPTARQCWNLGLVYEEQGDLTAALPLIEEATQIAERIGMPRAAEWRAHLEDLRARVGGAG
jgi:tetratricopeptide (TPR) repeat protein